MKATISLALAALAAASLLAQQQPTFKSGTRTVAIYATVTDKDGRLVPDLTRDDFEIIEDNTPQPLTIFSADIQPVSVVVMLDRSGSMKANHHLVVAAAEQFVRRMLPDDKARIGTFAEKVHIEPESFTESQQELIRILRSDLQTAGPTPLWNAVTEAMTALKPQEGRRVVLVFTDGKDNPGAMRFNNATLMDVMGRAQREDVMIYAIGLESRMAPAPGAGVRGGSFGGGFGANPLGVEKPDPGLPMIAGETGGGYFELTRADDLAKTFARVSEELHKQYSLGFEPTKLDGKVHKIKVRVKKDGMTVRARKTYLAQK